MTTEPASNAQPQPPSPASSRGRRLTKRLGYCLGAVLLAVLAYLLLWPSPIDSVAYEPPPKPMLEGPLAPNRLLESAELLGVGQLVGPEDIEVDRSGNIYAGTLDGRIVVFNDGAGGDYVVPGGKTLHAKGEIEVKTIATTGGRPLGIATAANGDLIVADAVKGLLSVSPDGRITTLPTDVAGKPVHFADDLDIARDGRIFFSDASDKFGIDGFLYDMLEGRPHGRLLRYDPATKTTTVLLSDLYFANGVALSQHEDFVLVNETYRFRVTRYWLKGERAGKSEVFVDNLPGYPDNITSNRHGTFWLALVTVRNETGDWLSPHPFLKNTLAKLPRMFLPKPQPYGFVIKLDETGRILESFQDPSGKHLPAITSAFEHDGSLYLGSLSNNFIGKFKLP
ncbi:MAG TPA: SMP-30/gluconolactonase/LRE family protein [Planctomycetaceae bacterium]|nr:SMP-30/gluconolactonase/LRE family protein [Planctomycetaceae bacterium]